MFAGFAEREYTPAEGMVPGQIKCGYAKGKRTPLMAHAAVVESNGRAAILVSLDVIFVTVDFANALRERISEATQVPAEYIMIHTTHTHTGCETDITCWGCPANPDALIPVAQAAVEAASAAKESCAEVKMGTATGFDGRFNFCRDFFMKDGRIVTNPGHKCEENLLKPVSVADHSVNVMRFDDLEGNPKAFGVNYANHLDTNAHYDKFDADYAGYLRVALRREYGDDVCVVFLNGCCGDVNHLDFLNHWDQGTHIREGVLGSEVIGEGLAQTIVNLTPPLVTKEKEVLIQAKYATFPVARRFATPEMKEWAGRFLEYTAKKREAGEKYNRHDELCAIQYLEDESSYPQTVDVGVHVMQIGEWVIVGLPGEIYSEIGRKIKALSPFANTVVVELADGSHGYIAPDYIQRAGCYEGIYSNIAYTGLGTADTLIEGATLMLKGLYETENVVTFGEVKEKRIYRQM